jgi:hypothetical protein
MATLNGNDLDTLFKTYKSMFDQEKRSAGSQNTVSSEKRQMIVKQAVNKVHEKSEENYLSILE